MSYLPPRTLCLLNAIVVVSLMLFLPVRSLAQLPADSWQRSLPELPGWAKISGGCGAQVVRVTTLSGGGPGSLREALAAKGPRIVVFEVGGVIDLARKSISIKEPFVTVAGQTAPRPGITLIRGGVQISTHDVLIQHLRVRPGTAGAAKKSGWEVDAVATNAAWNVIVDHCSCTWATDENLSASGPRFEGGDSVEQWRKNTSHRITISNCIIAECLDNATHGKGAHSKGTLIHDNATEITIVANLYANNVQRNPLFKGGAQGVIVNNFISNPGNRAIHYRLPASEWKGREYAEGRMVVVGNVMQTGADTRDDVPLVKYGGEGLFHLFLQDNIATNREGKKVDAFKAVSPRPGREYHMLSQRTLWPPSLQALPAEKVKEFVTRNAGARPWDRDEIDARIVNEALAGTGRIIDHQDEVGGYPTVQKTQAPFNPADWPTLLNRK